MVCSSFSHINILKLWHITCQFNPNLKYYTLTILFYARYLCAHCQRGMFHCGLHIIFVYNVVRHCIDCIFWVSSVVGLLLPDSTLPFVVLRLAVLFFFFWICCRRLCASMLHAVVEGSSSFILGVHQYLRKYKSVFL